MPMGHFDNSGVSDSHALWAGGGLLAGFIFRANGWVRLSEKGKPVLNWASCLSDLTSAAAIYGIALAVSALFRLSPAEAAGVCIVLVVVGLRPAAAKLEAWIDAWTARFRGLKPD